MADVKGGKGKGLVWLVQNVDELNEDCGTSVQVPEFENLNVTFYDDFLNDSFDRLEARCTELAEQFKGRSVAVRSSAVASEDTSKNSGAGIYHTGFVAAEDLSPDTLADAVIDVYESVDSNEAIQYRKEAGIECERMEVLVQERVGGLNGVIMSRLPARAGIIPVWWSSETGEAVSGGKGVKTAYFKEDNLKKEFFRSDNVSHDSLELSAVANKVIPLVFKLKEKYGMDYQAEFCLDMESGQVYMVQIRPLTNVQDVVVNFPDKKPIMKADHVMGAGEYIGPWKMPKDIKDGWDEPLHYALMATKIEETKQVNENQRDIDALTPNKKAMVLTNSKGPGVHALTIANEKGILCLCRDEEDLGDEEYSRSHPYTKQDVLRIYGKEDGAALLQIPNFDCGINTVGDNVHVVCDGLEGFVYKATPQEADEFANRMATSTNYMISKLEVRGDDEFYDLEVVITPSDLTLCPTICEDFGRYMQEVSEGKLQAGVRGAVGVDLFPTSGPNRRYEAFGAFYDYEDRSDGVTLMTARFQQELIDKKTAVKWFEGFIERVQSPDYNPLG